MIAIRPSGLARYIACAASIQYPSTGESSEYARRGTYLHALARRSILGHPLPDALRLCAACGAGDPGSVCPSCGDPRSVDASGYLDLLRRYHDYVQAMRDAHVVHEMGVETPIKSIGHPRLHGTVDCWLRYGDEHRRQWIHVIDLKTGYDVPSAAGNPQLLAYCFLLWERHAGVSRFRTTIVSTSGIDTHDVEDVDGVRAIGGIVDSLPDGGATNPGPWCQYCPGATTLRCPEILSDDAKIVIKPEDIATAAKLLARKEAIAAAMRAAEAMVRESLMYDAASVPGFRLASTRPREVWRDNSEAVGNLRLAFGEDVESMISQRPPTPSAVRRAFADDPTAAPLLATLAYRAPPKLVVARDGEAVNDTDLSLTVDDDI